MANKIYEEAQSLSPELQVELFEIDATNLGGDIFRFHGYVQVGSIYWQGNEYKQWPLASDGFEVTGAASQPSPTLTLANAHQTLSPLVGLLDDLVGAKVTRMRTLGKFLDARNFTEGNPTADPNEYFTPDVYYINQKASEDLDSIQFSLKSALDLEGVFLPRRMIQANICPWLQQGGYRGPNCGYTGNVYTNLDGSIIADASKDKCNGKLSTCKIKFTNNGQNNVAVIPYGGFPAASLVKS